MTDDGGLRRVGFDPRRELEHLTRSLSLDKRQSRLVLAQLGRNYAALRRHAAERQAHRDRTLALHRRLMRLNAVLERKLVRMGRDEAERWRRVRTLLRPEQGKVFDMIMAERRRIEAMIIELEEKKARGAPAAGTEMTAGVPGSPLEGRTGLPDDPDMRRVRDRVGFDPRREMRHLTRNLSLDETQRLRVFARLKRNNAELHRHAAARRAHRDRVRAIHKRLKVLNAALDRDLGRMGREAAAGWRRVRAILTPAQRKTFDTGMAERRRIETGRIELAEQKTRGLPPPRGPV